jgi:hypothetical protein
MITIMKVSDILSSISKQINIRHITILIKTDATSINLELLYNNAWVSTDLMVKKSKFHGACDIYSEGDHYLIFTNGSIKCISHNISTIDGRIDRFINRISGVIKQPITLKHIIIPLISFEMIRSNQEIFNLVNTLTTGEFPLRKFKNRTAFSLNGDRILGTSSIDEITEFIGLLYDNFADKDVLNDENIVMEVTI